MNFKSHILLVEDDHCIRSLMEEVLVGEGYHLTSVQNGHNAILHLRERPFDLLITDFRMPLLSGVDLLNWCNHNHIHLPVIFMSATSQLLMEEKDALENLEATLLHKPFNLEYFLAIVKNSLDQKHLLEFMQHFAS